MRGKSRGVRGLGWHVHNLRLGNLLSIPFVRLVERRHAVDRAGHRLDEVKLPLAEILSGRVGVLVHGHDLERGALVVDGRANEEGLGLGEELALQDRCHGLHCEREANAG